MAPPTPRLNGSRHTIAPDAMALTEVRSPEPSSTTRTSNVGSTALTEVTTPPTDASSFHAGTTTRTREEGTTDGMASTLRTSWAPRTQMLIWYNLPGARWAKPIARAGRLRK